VDDGPPRGLSARDRQRFVHTDVISAYSPWCSPSTPDDYVRALARQYALGPESDKQPRPALAIADYGLHSAVKSAVACDRAGIDHIVGLRVRVVPQRTKRTFFVISPERRSMRLGHGRGLHPNLVTVNVPEVSTLLRSSVGRARPSGRIDLTSRGPSCLHAWAKPVASTVR
jgi:hypothetical protein